MKTIRPLKPTWTVPTISSTTRACLASACTACPLAITVEALAMRSSVSVLKRSWKILCGGIRSVRESIFKWCGITSRSVKCFFRWIRPGWICTRFHIHCFDFLNQSVWDRSICSVFNFATFDPPTSTRSAPFIFAFKAHKNRVKFFSTD